MVFHSNNISYYRWFVLVYVMGIRYISLYCFTKYGTWMDNIFCTGIITGALSFIYAFYIRTFNRTLKYLLNAFTGDFVLDLYWVWTITMSVFIFFRIRLLAMNLNMMLFFRDHQEENVDIVKRDSGWKIKTLPDGYNFVQIKSSCAVTISRGWQVYG